LLVAVILSTQRTDKKVNQVPPTLFAAADNPAAMARLRKAKIESIIKPVGLADRSGDPPATAVRLFCGMVVAAFSQRHFLVP